MKSTIDFSCSFGLIFAAFIFVSNNFSNNYSAAETVLINGGGTFEGKVSDSRESPLQVELNHGIVFSVDPKRVQTKKDARSERLLYDAFAPFESDTIENHLKIAAWCNEHYLGDLAQVHYNRILELDPEHLEARQRLGFTKDKRTGQWSTSQERMTRRGYVPYQGGWKLPQEVWILEQAQMQKKAELQWKQDLRKIRKSLDSEQVRNQFVAIEDPVAVGPIAESLRKEESPDVRILYLRALANIGNLPAMREIAVRYMDDSNEEVCRTALDLIRRRPESIPTIGAFFGGFLNNVNPDGTAKNDARTIRKAAYGIGTIGARGQIPTLVDALVSRHKTVTEVGNGGRTNAGFSSSGGTSFQGGSSQVVRITESENGEVLDALKKLTGVNFRYDRNAWKSWMQEKRSTILFDARRG